MSMLNDTVRDLKKQGGTGVDTAALRSLALETAFDLLDEDSQLEVCEAIKEAQEAIWTDADERNEQRRERAQA